ncbi:YidB family protein [Streptomyces umbrinus]|uniref:YidB family protein n=1 Tax=Streptomyces umbrinus TaxID=67370 RepID=UPI003F4CB878
MQADPRPLRPEAHRSDFAEIKGRSHRRGQLHSKWCQVVIRVTLVQSGSSGSRHEPHGTDRPPPRKGTTMAGNDLGSLLGSVLGGGARSGTGGGAGGVGGAGGAAILGSLLQALMNGRGGSGGTGSGTGNGGNPLGGLMDLLTRSGLAEQKDCWVGTGDNQSVTGAQIQQALPDETLKQVADEAGVTTDRAATEIAQTLPQVVDRLSPDGHLPDASLEDLVRQQRF